MTDYTVSLTDVIKDRAERGMADLLLAVFDAGVSMGMGIPRAAPDNPSTAALLATIAERWFCEIEACRAWRRSETPDLQPELIPAWLLEQAAERKETT